MKVPFDQLKVGDFFRIDLPEFVGVLLYQKITSKNGYNAVLINTGELSQLYIPADSDKMFEKVEVHFEIRSL